MKRSFEEDTVPCCAVPCNEEGGRGYFFHERTNKTTNPPFFQSVCPVRKIFIIPSPTEERR